MTRKALMVANWKMNHGISDSLQFISRFQKELVTSQSVEIGIAPPFTSLYSLSVIITDEESPILLGGQNCHWENNGAYTGEISPQFLKEMNCSFVILGHSERREYFHESDEDIAKKCESVLRSEMRPLLCVGETLEEREAGKTWGKIESQLEAALGRLPQEDLTQIIIAYEPIWAIGTGKTATPEQAEEIHKQIRDWYSKKTNANIADNLRILYGGSVKPENIKELMSKENIDGALIGGASLLVDSFKEIVNYT